MRGGTSGTDGRLLLTSHVVQDYIHVDSHADFTAALDHTAELLLVTRARHQAVRNGLVALPPRSLVVLSDDNIFLHGRYLHGPVAHRPKEVFAFGRDVVPLPLEEVHDGVAPGCHVWLALGA